MSKKKKKKKKTTTEENEEEEQGLDFFLNYKKMNCLFSKYSGR